LHIRGVDIMCYFTFLTCQA